MKPPFATRCCLRPPPPPLVQHRRVVSVGPPLRTSSFNGGGVGTLRGKGILRCHGHNDGGDSPGSNMNLFDRLAMIMKSYLNAFLASIEDPEKVLEQAVVDMNKDLETMQCATMLV